MEVEFERIEYDYNNCKILLENCRNSVQDLHTNLKIDPDEYVLRDQIITELEEIMSKIY